MMFYKFDDAALKDAEKVIRKLSTSTVGEVFKNLKEYTSIVFSPD